ncbi:MAG: SMC family ATPase, partial [Spirochaeta sp.]|nr:SMC family ATPase [Spirochaeta sp.]
DRFEGELHRAAAAWRAARTREGAGEMELEQLRTSAGEEKHRDGAADPTAADPTGPAGTIDQIADDLDALWARHQELHTLAEQQAAHRDQRDRLQRESAERTSRLATEDGRITEIERRLARAGDELPPALREHEDPATLEAEIREITDKLSRLSADLQSAREGLTAARSAEDHAVATEQERQASRARAEEAARAAEQDLAAAMGRIGVAPEEDVPALMEAAATVDDLRRRIEEYDGAVRDARSQRRALEEKLRTQTPPELDQPIDTALGEAAARVTAAETLIQETDTAIGELTNRRSVLEGQRERRAALTAERDALAVRKANIDTLLRLFTGNRFVTFVAQVFLEQLVIVANDRFRRLTRNRLELVLRGDHEFEVIDFLNGGRRRSVKTLSGGQTFQAALCLALALVDSIDRAGGSDQPGFFFLDEGFGSLDEEALQDVFATLTDLRRENRIVGVISHVESLQQEIDAFLRVRIDQERGSEIVSGYTGVAPALQ